MSADVAVMSDEDRAVVDFRSTRLRRAEILADCMPRIQSFVEEADSTVEDLVYDGPLGPVRISYLEADAIRTLLAQDGDSSETSRGLLLAEALAACVKISEDVQDYQIAARLDEQLEEKIRSALELDDFAGESLIEELAEAIDRTFAAGRREEAVRLGELRLTIRQHITHIRLTLSGRQDGEAHTPPTGAPAATGPFTRPSAGWLADANLEPPPDQLEQSRRRYQALKKRRLQEQRDRANRRRIRWMFAGVGMAMLVGVASFAIQFLPSLETDQLSEITVESLEGVPGISSVVAKPPSLFVTVNGAYWDSLDRHHRTRIVTEIGSILIRANYNGAVFNHPNGTVVGEWIRGSGSYVYPLE